MTGVRLIHRYFLAELLANAIASLLVVFSIFFLAALSLEVGKTHYENLPMIVILKYVGLLLLYTAYLTIPMSVITTCIFTYGRAAQDGEIAAAQTSGVPLMKLFLPAYFVGATAMLILAILQDQVMPGAHYASRNVDESVFLNVEQILKRPDKEIKEKSFLFKWGSVDEDGTGNLVLKDVQLVQYRGQKTAAWSDAKRARPVTEPGSTRVTLELEDVHRAEDGGAFWASTFSVLVDLAALINPGTKNENDLSYEELLSGVDSATTEKKANKLGAEFHFRLAMSIAAFLLGALAAPLGIAFRIRNRAVVFLAGVLIMTLGYLPLIIVARALAEKGAFPAWAVLQGPNVIFAIGAVFLSWKANRP